ncbi:uncharacterized protein LOC125553728 [Triticum urartu]|uniref:Uncharacterized protein n=1 Tax=Triticum urartu TaxID=4572 RepID=A0A8R7Q434_TRIUA|nr:uncharacterized protein LOC125553728 [Triticum urartu]
MERSAGGGDDSARAVGMCDRLLTFLAKNLSMNRPRSITEGPRDAGAGRDHRNHAEEEDDEFAVKIEKAEFEFSHEEEGHRSFTATILEETTADVRASDQHKEATGEAGHQVEATEAGAAAVQEKKPRRTVTIKEEAGGVKDKAKKSLSMKRQSSSLSGGGQVVGAGGEDPVPKPPLRWGLRPRMPAANLRVPSNINEKSSNFIEERRRGFGAGGKPGK